MCCRLHHMLFCRRNLWSTDYAHDGRFHNGHWRHYIGFVVHRGPTDCRSHYHRYRQRDELVHRPGLPKRMLTCIDPRCPVDVARHSHNSGSGHRILVSPSNKMVLPEEQALNSYTGRIMARTPMYQVSSGDFPLASRRFSPSYSFSSSLVYPRLLVGLWHMIGLRKPVPSSVT